MSQYLLAGVVMTTLSILLFATPAEYSALVKAAMVTFILGFGLWITVLRDLFVDAILSRGESKTTQDPTSDHPAFDRGKRSADDLRRTIRDLEHHLQAASIAYPRWRTLIALGREWIGRRLIAISLAYACLYGLYVTEVIGKGR